MPAPHCTPIISAINRGDRAVGVHPGQAVTHLRIAAIYGDAAIGDCQSFDDDRCPAGSQLGGCRSNHHFRAIKRRKRLSHCADSPARPDRAGIGVTDIGGLRGRVEAGVVTADGRQHTGCQGDHRRAVICAAACQLIGITGIMARHGSAVRNHEDRGLLPGSLTHLRQSSFASQSVGIDDELAQRALAGVTDADDGVEVEAEIDAGNICSAFYHGGDGLCHVVAVLSDASVALVVLSPRPPRSAFRRPHDR